HADARAEDQLLSVYVVEERLDSKRIAREVQRILTAIPDRDREVAAQTIPGLLAFPNEALQDGSRERVGRCRGPCPFLRVEDRSVDRDPERRTGFGSASRGSDTVRGASGREGGGAENDRLGTWLRRRRYRTKV